MALNVAPEPKRFKTMLVSHELNFVAQVYGILIGILNYIIGSKVIAILLNWCILPIGGVASGRVRAGLRASAVGSFFLFGANIKHFHYDALFIFKCDFLLILFPYSCLTMCSSVSK